MEDHPLIDNRYQLQGELGNGGMGTVYLAHDTHSNTYVAIKHLRPDLMNPNLIERFRREGEALRELNHPNIVKLLATVEEDNQHYLVMEYISGGDLADRLAQDLLPIERIVYYAIDLADALTRAHKLNIIHRDLKPGNILLAPDGSIRLTDFGVAFAGDNQQNITNNNIVGTISYLAPEIIQGMSANRLTDIWAFGLILFEMLAGRLPFRRDNYAKTLYAIINDPLPDLELLRMDAPIELIDLVYRMIERDPQSRISSVRYIGAALEDILHGRTSRQPKDRRFDAPSDETPRSAWHNLPMQATPFVGRGAEVNAINRLLDNPVNRLVTILAPGGMGKTRLSLEVARHQLEKFRDGVFFIELAPLSNPEDIVNAIAEALSYQFHAGDAPPRQQIIDLLSRKTMMLVMDNFEHLLDGAKLIGDIIKASQHITFLVSSRKRLGQSGETLFHLSGMESMIWRTLDEARQYGSVQLFLQSAQRVRPDFELTEDNLVDVNRICQLVQGMPLGIILSASWLGVLNPAEVVQEMDHSLDFLTTDEIDLPERQRSIRAVFDYSWESMTASEQNIFMKLSVFRGGFTREAAEKIADATLRGLMTLSTKSLIHRNSDTGRYTIHELLRQYAEEKLQTAQLLDQTREVHANCYVKMAETAEIELRYADQEFWYRRLEDEHDNIRYALDWAFNYNIPLAARMMIALRDFWFYQGYHSEAYTWGQKLFPSLDELDTILTGRFYGYFASFAWIMQNMPEAIHYFELSIETLRITDEKRYIAWALLYAMGATTNYQSRHEETLGFFHEALQLFEEVDDRAGIATLYNMVGALHQRMGNYELAADAFRQCIERSRQNGELRRVAINTMNLGKVKGLQGEPEAGFILLKEAGEIMQKIGFRYMLLYILTSYVDLLVEVNLYKEALVVASAYFSLSESLGMKIQPWSMGALNRAIDQIKMHLDTDIYQSAQTYGQSMTLERINDYTLSITLE